MWLLQFEVCSVVSLSRENFTPLLYPLMMLSFNLVVTLTLSPLACTSLPGGHVEVHLRCTGLGTPLHSPGDNLSHHHPVHPDLLVTIRYPSTPLTHA